MKIRTLLSSSILALITYNQSTLAQESAPPPYPKHPQMYEQMMGGRGMPPADMPYPMHHQDFRRPPMPPQFMPEFPSPEELSRMTPPEPLTEEKIRQRFARQKANLQESLERDRKAAEKYASDFARMQKYQADRLAEIMADAEKRREMMLQRLEQREQELLEQFRQQQAPETPAAEKEAT